jgi:hypothetical protein
MASNRFASFVFAIALSVMVGCASLPVKQQAAVSLKTVLTTVEMSRQVERTICNPSVTSPTTPILTCVDSSPISTQKHRQLALLYAAAFRQISNSADAFLVWTPIESRPSLPRIVSTLHLIKVEVTPLATKSNAVNSMLLYLDQSLGLLDKIQLLR